MLAMATLNSIASICDGEMAQLPVRRHTLPEPSRSNCLNAFRITDGPPDTRWDTFSCTRAMSLRSRSGICNIVTPPGQLPHYLWRL